MDEIHVLVVDDSDDDALLIIRQLGRAGMPVSHVRADTAEGVDAALAARAPDIVISDYTMPSFRAEQALEQVRAYDADIPFLLVSGQVGEETAAAMMRAGARDFVLKERLDRLGPAVQREMREATERRRRRRAEAALRESEERFRLLAEHAQDIIFRYRLVPEPAMEYLSPAVETIIGYRPEQFYEHPGLIFSLAEPADRAVLAQSWCAEPRSDEPRSDEPRSDEPRSDEPEGAEPGSAEPGSAEPGSAEPGSAEPGSAEPGSAEPGSAESAGTVTIRWRRRTGDVVWIEQRAAAVHDEQGRPIAIEGILRDITERVRAEQSRAELEQQLRQAERLDSLGRLAGGIAHDFNNILAIISGYAAMLTEELDPAGPNQADARAIEQAAARGSALTRQLLIFSRLEPSRPETLDLNVVATDMQRLLARTLGEDIELRTVPSLDLPPITMDRSKLEQVLMNAVMNSRAAMPCGGRLTIGTAAGSDGSDGWDGGFVELTITDTGCGMAPEVAARAFEPFFTTKGRGNGTGLGLATAYGVVTDAGGTIALESEPDQGTTVRVRLPAGSPGPVGDLPVGRAVPAGGRGQRILVVEDEDGVRDIVGRILKKAGYNVYAAGDPQEALKLCLDGNLHVDALLSDVIMPGLSGTQLAAELRKNRPGLPVLFMSGYTSGPKPGGQELPSDAPLLYKPFQTDQLLQALDQLLHRNIRTGPTGSEGAGAAGD